MTKAGNVFDVATGRQQRLRVGIVGASVSSGASDWAVHAHLPALESLSTFQLKAVCTSRADTAQRSAHRYGAELAFDDVAAMATHPDVDLVVVALRVPSHLPVVLTALESHKPVLCEWPLGATRVEAEQMQHAAAAAGVRTFVGMQGRCDPAVVYAGELLAKGAIGDVLSADLSHISVLQTVCKPSRTWMASRAGGATPLTIHGGHAMDLLARLIGELASVSAQVSTKVNQWTAQDGAPIAVDAPDTCLVYGRTDAGVAVSATVRAVPVGDTGCDITVFGTQGALHLTSRGPASVGPWTLAMRTDAGVQVLTPQHRHKASPDAVPDGVGANVAHAYATIAADLARGPAARMAPTFEDAVELHRLIDAIERSSASGTEIPLRS